MEVPAFLIYTGAWLGIASGVWALFERAETVLTSDARVAISKWLRNLDPGSSVINWTGTFVMVFDRLFGERHFSWKCFFRSAIASLVTVIIVFILALSLFLKKSQELQGPELIEVSRFIISSIIPLLFAFSILNLIPDYLSLLETRYVLRWMSSATTVRRNLLLLFLDFVFTGIIALGVFLVTSWVLFTSSEGMTPLAEIVKTFPQTITNLLLLNFEVQISVEPWRDWDFPMGVFFYSTFLTSVWLWLYALGSMIIKTVVLLRIGLTQFRRIFDIENKPLRSIGMVCNLIIAIIFLVCVLCG